MMRQGMVFRDYVPEGEPSPYRSGGFVDYIPDTALPLVPTATEVSLEISKIVSPFAEVQRAFEQDMDYVKGVPQKPCICTYCGKGFDYARILARHLSGCEKAKAALGQQIDEGITEQQQQEIDTKDFETEIKRKGGRPKGSKNRAKRGRE